MNKNLTTRNTIFNKNLNSSFIYFNNLKNYFKKFIKFLLNPLIRSFENLLTISFQKIAEKPLQNVTQQNIEILNHISALRDAHLPLHEKLKQAHIEELLTETQEGKFYFNVQDTVIGWFIAFHQTWEHLETSFIKSIVSEEDRVIDIGANLGWYSIVTGNIVGNKGLVLAFEPEPKNFSLLMKNITVNNLENQIKAFQLAIMDADSEIEFGLSLDNFGDHRPELKEKNELAKEQLNESSRISMRVPAKNLDSFLNEMSLSGPFKLLKIDAQGSEIAIFRGSQKTLNLCEYMIAEFWPYGLNRMGGTLDEWVELIQPHFDEFSRIGRDNVSFKPIELLKIDIKSDMDIDPGPLGYTNYVLRKVR